MDVIIGWVRAIDRTAFSFINKQLKSRVLDNIMPKITHLGGAISTISTIVLLLLFARGTIRNFAIDAAISLSLSHIVVLIIKKIYHRERPYIKLPDVNHYMDLIDHSFPSGHTTASFSIAIVFALHSFFLAIIAIPIAVIISLSRIYLGLHYPSDIIAGALLGTLSSLSVVQLLPPILAL